VVGDQELTVRREGDGFDLVACEAFDGGPFTVFEGEQTCFATAINRAIRGEGEAFDLAKFGGVLLFHVCLLFLTFFGLQFLFDGFGGEFFALGHELGGAGEVGQSSEGGEANDEPDADGRGPPLGRRWSRFFGSGRRSGCVVVHETEYRQ